MRFDKASKSAPLANAIFALSAASVSLSITLAVTLAVAMPERALALPGKEEEKAKQPISFDEYKNTVSSIKIKDHMISFVELQKIIDKPDVVVLDLRSEHEYKDGHLKNAIDFGCDMSEEKLSKVIPSKDATVVVYCTNNFSPSRRLSLNNSCLPQLISLGYKNAKVLEDLWQGDWKKVEEIKKGPLWVLAPETKK